MRKIIVLLMCCLVLGGCAKGEAQSTKGVVEAPTESEIDVAKEYSYSELKEMYNEFADEWTEELSKLSDIELSGMSSNENEHNEHFFKVSNELIDKIIKDCPISQNQKIIVSGYISKPRESSEDSIFVKKGAGKIFFHLKHNAEDDTYDGISCRTDDFQFLRYQENTPVKIEGVFIKQGVAASEDVLYDCKIIESGVPDLVTETKEPLATPAFK